MNSDKNRLSHPQVSDNYENAPATLSSEEKRASFKQGALNAWKSYQENGLHLSTEEADAWLEKLEAGKNVGIPKLTSHGIAVR